MIAKISRGWRIGGLIRYLMGPGRFNEHADQRIVAAWDGNPGAHQPQHTEAGGFDVAALAAALADPAVAAGVSQRTPGPREDGRVPRGPVWHCSLRNPAEDRPLSDEEWAEVVEDLMDRTGIARRGDGGACRWVSIRHGSDHVHVAAMLVRQDNGRRVQPRNDYLRAREVCRDAEVRLSLAETAPADRTAPAPSSRAEQEKAQRRGGDESSRERLRRSVRQAAVRAQDDDGFFTELRDMRLLVKMRMDPDGRPVGYAVAAVGDTNADGQPVWFAGGSLARDLTLPKLRERWACAPVPREPIPPAAGERSRVGQQERDAAVGEATDSVLAATADLRERREAAEAAGSSRTDPAGAGGPDAEDSVEDEIAHAAGDMLESIGSATTDPRSDVDRRRQRDVSDHYDRAARVPGLVQPRRWGPVAAELRRAAWRLAAVRRIGGGGGGQELIVALAQLVAEIAALREQQQRAAQAAAARRSLSHLSERSVPGAAGRSRHRDGHGRTVPQGEAARVTSDGRSTRTSAAADAGRRASPTRSSPRLNTATQPDRRPGRGTP